jgi:hypothetical protein
VTPRPRLRAVHYAPPPARRRGITVKDVDELLTQLAARGLV